MSTPNTATDRDAVPRPPASPASSAGTSGARPLTEPRHNPLWWIVLAAFALQIAVWTAWFIIAAHHRVAEVPLATKDAK